MLHMLDTDAASYVIKTRSPALVARLAALPPEQVCISVITRVELLYGLQSLAPDHRLHLGVRRFLALFATLVWDEAAAEHYAEIRHKLTTTGKPIGETDMMIAAAALGAKAALITNNQRHFSRIGPTLQLLDWATDTAR